MIMEYRKEAYTVQSVEGYVVDYQFMKIVKLEVALGDMERITVNKI